MIACPNCGEKNPPDNFFCDNCGNVLDQGSAPAMGAGQPPRGGQPSGGGRDDIFGQLRALSSASAPADDDSSGDMPDWLSELSRQGDNVELPTILGARISTDLPPASPAEETANLPDWLRGAAPAAKPTEEIDWAPDLDFSDLPVWLQPAEQTDADNGDSEMPDWVRQGLAGAGLSSDTTLEPPPEGEGSGLLSGVAGPIPVEPVIALPHKAPPFPGYSDDLVSESLAAEEDISLFSAIATGMRAAPSLPMERVRQRPLPILFPLLLLLAVIGGLLAPPMTNPPADLTAPILLARTVDALPPESHVLIAFDYEGSRFDELEPGVLMLLRHLESRQARVVAISTTPFGPALAQHAWTSVATQPGWGSPTYGERFVNMGFLPGSEAGLRTLLGVTFAGDALQNIPDIIAGQPLASLDVTRDLNGLGDFEMIVVVTSESRDVQLWVEQIGSFMNTLPIVAVVPAAVEPALMPYVASGQVRAMLAGLVQTAGYEKQLSPGYQATRRLNAVAAALLVFILVVVAGNIVAQTQRLRHQREG